MIFNAMAGHDLHADNSHINNKEVKLNFGVVCNNLDYLKEQVF